MYLSKNGFSEKYEGDGAFSVTGGIYLEATGLGALNVRDLNIADCKFEDGQEIKVHVINQYLDGTYKDSVVALLRKENSVWRHYSDAYIEAYKKGIIDGDSSLAINFLEVDRVVNTLLFENDIKVNEKELDIKVSCLEYSSEQKLNVDSTDGFGDISMGFTNIELTSANLVDKNFNDFNVAYDNMVSLAEDGLLDSVCIEQNGVIIAELIDLMSEPKMKVATFGNVIDKLNKLYIICKNVA